MISKYQDVQSISKLPKSEWQLIKFEDLLIDNSKQASKIKKGSYFEEGKFPIIDQGKSYISGYTSSSEGLYEEIPAIVFGDHTRVLKYVDFPLFLGADGVKLLRNKKSEEEVLTKYIYYYLCTINLPDTGYNRHFKYLKEIVFPIPNISIQKKIVQVLDKSHETINKRKAQIEALDQLTQSVFVEMFGDPIKNNKGYQTEKLSNLSNKITDGTHHSPPSTEEGVPYITAKHLREDGLDFYSNPTYVSKDEHKKIYARCNPEKGDVLYIKDGVTTGIARINKYDFQFSMLSSLALIKPNVSRINSYYLVYYLNNQGVFNRITNNMSGGAIKRLTLKKINQIEVNVPPIELQNQFSKYIQEIEQKKLILKQGEKLLENNYNSIMQRAFKGELFTQEELLNA
ncbi:restriction endonuclease subunit S [Salipaludibacillus agaradhaerens]|uniref:Restriction endonuclease subunit S n=1 Tax=Salipaludibacillus agaradhaerens TaxID=76935 RepID=A0A9Q4B4D7_SALAG|nr:restriction endonuclease subunit S [Salipaludibacillus agaradhaerens]MCR6112751.1 restriction endonuclease subunit S [Salipaludibacillus agaradhaerens]